MEQSDQVGRTSARLLANGVGRHDRLDALHLLGILDASADATGRVRRPLGDLAAEFELDPAEVARSLGHLEEADAIWRDTGALVLLDRDEDGAGGLLLADFIDDVRAALGDDVRPEPSHWRVRAGAALVAAAAFVGVVAFTPSTSVPTPSVALGDASDRVDSSSTSSLLAPGRSTSTSATSLDVPATAVTPVPGAAPPIVDGTVAAASCPDEDPVVEVAGTGILVTNPTDVDIIVSELAVDGSPVPVSAFVVPAHSTVTPATVVPATAHEVSLLDWDWDDPIIGERCA